MSSITATDFGTTLHLTTDEVTALFSVLARVRDETENGSLNGLFETLLDSGDISGSGVVTFTRDLLTGEDVYDDGEEDPNGFIDSRFVWVVGDPE